MVLYFILIQTFYYSESLFNPLWVDPNWIIIFVSGDLGVGVGNGNISRAERPRDEKSANYASGEMIKEPEEEKNLLKEKKKFETTDQQLSLIGPHYLFHFLFPLRKLVLYILSYNCQKYSL